MEPMQSPQSIRSGQVIAGFVTMFIQGQVLIFFNYSSFSYHSYASNYFWTFSFTSHMDTLIICS